MPTVGQANPPMPGKMGLDVEDLHAGYPACKQPTQCHTGCHTKYRVTCGECAL